MKKIALGVTGSIAAYKAVDVTSELTKLGHRVTVVMTKDAQAFIPPPTLQNAFTPTRDHQPLRRRRRLETHPHSGC